jgi:catechol 2,3-dioxygenase-like lactoylglutathione lyase family enzyme
VLFYGPMPTRHAALVPILPSSDLERSLAYYKYLGFDVLEHEKDYARLAWRGAELHLYPHPGLDPLANSAGCYLRVAAPHLVRTAWLGDGVECLDLPIPAHCGATVFAVVDPDGNTLRIGPEPDPAAQ